MATYHQQIYAIDVAVGMIGKPSRKAAPRKIPLSSTHLIMVSSVVLMGTVPKYCLMRNQVRVPLVIYDPRHQNSGKKLRSSALTGNIDFAPTILKLAGLPSP